jgi:fumarate reductase flavoprotein subunit
MDDIAMKFLLSAACAALLASFALTSAAADGPFLADRHVAKGMKCETCHTADNKLKEFGDLDICASCHGDYKAKIEKTKGKYETNPHAQHEGALPCSECHKGHQKGVNYCGGCHNFVYNVP